MPPKFDRRQTVRTGLPVRAIATPAVPVTEAQRQRYERILQVANILLSAGGEDALQMKEVAKHADVALGTIYRYFPSKDYLLLAIAYNRYKRALDVVRKAPVSGATPGERVANLLIRQFRAEQREPLVTAATARVMHETDRAYRETLERISGLHQEVLRLVARGDGPPLSSVLERTLIVVSSCFSSATRGWLSGQRSSAEARFEIRVACRLLDLPEELLAQDLKTAAQTTADDRGR